MDQNGGFQKVQCIMRKGDYMKELKQENGARFKDTHGKHVYILFDEASSYWMIAYDYRILDQVWHSYASARDYLLERGCVKWEDE